MAQQLRTDLLAVARAYCDGRGIALSSLGQYMLGSSVCLAELRDGKRKMVAEVYDQSLQWMSDRWPPKARWPAHVGRPTPQPLPEEKTA